MKTSTQKMHINLEREILKRILPIATEEFNGNVSQYIRVTIFNDLVRRGRLTNGERKIIDDQTSNN